MNKIDLNVVGIDAIQNMMNNEIDLIRLESGDTNLKPEGHIIEITKKAIGKIEYNTYVPFNGLQMLRQSICNRIEEDYGLTYDPNSEVVVTAGGTEGMLDSLLSIVGPGDEVIMPEPIYAGMINRVKLSGATPIFVKLSQDNDWHLDLKAMREKVTNKTKAIFFVSPNSPTGTVFNYQELSGIADIAQEFNLVVIYNSVFDKIVFENKKQLNIAALSNMKDRTIVIGSVSKNYGMIGWRVGWVYGPEKYISSVNQVHISNAALANPASQIGAIAALEGSQDWVSDRSLIYRYRQDALLNIFHKEIPHVKSVRAEGGWSFISDIRKLTPSSYEFAQYLLKEAKVAVTPMKDWGGGSGEGFVRFVFSKYDVSQLEEAARRVVIAVNNFNI